MPSNRLLAPTTAALLAVAATAGCDRLTQRDESTAATTANRTAQPSTAAPQPSSTGVTIVMDPDTKGVKVQGGTPITGDPKKCAAFQACCKHPDASLFCGLLQASPDKYNCSQALDKVKQLLKERGSKPPPGC